MHKQTILITGASSGIGASFAKFLADKSIQVVLTARREERLMDIKREIESRGGTAHIIVADISKGDEREELFNEAIRLAGCVDILINNAGFGWYGYYTDMGWKLAKQMADVNIRAVMHLSSLFLPDMRERRSGHIINIGSISGALPNQGIAVYSSSKAFVDAFSTSLYRELRGSGVCISVVRLGPVETEFYDQARSRKNGRSIPAERFAIPTEQVNKSIWRLIKRPRRVMYVPGWLVITKHVENLFGSVIDLLGPLLLKRKSK